MTEIQLTEEEVYGRLKKILAEILVVREAAISPSHRLVDDLDADSIAFLELGYRVRDEFGVDFPDPKASEEILTMPLVDGMERLEATKGGTTLFEYMRGDSVRLAMEQPEARRALAEALASTLRPVQLRSDFAALIADARNDPKLARPLADWLLAISETEEPRRVLADVMGGEHAMNEGLSALAERSREGADSSPLDLSMAWAALLQDRRVRAMFRLIRVRDFALASQFEVPPDVDPEKPLNALQLRDLFRFITVRSYARYVLFLAKLRELRLPAAEESA